MASKFGKYKPEEEKVVRKVEVIEDKTLKQLKTAWKEFKYDENSKDPTNYECAMKATKALKCSASDVEKFSLAMMEFQGAKSVSYKTGLFLSALINNGKENDYVIHTTHLDARIALIGHRNTKNITVEGDAGMWCGFEMEGGSIIVRGDAGNWCGYLMKGGSIHVDGEIGRISDDIIHGKIFHKGKLIVDK